MSPASNQRFSALRLPVDLRLRRILVVDSDDTSREILLRRLAALHLHELRVASSGMEAYDLLQRAEVPIDLLITELDLPGHDGYALIRSIRNSRDLADPQIAIIAVSGVKDGQILSRLQRLDVVSLLVKPVTGRKLFDAISVALRNTKPRPPEVKTL